MNFQIYKKNYFLYNDILDFINKEYYPLSLVRSCFAFHINILFLFHKIYTKESSSKQIYVNIIYILVQFKSSIEVKLLTFAPC